MLTLVIVIAVIAYLAFHLGAGHTHHRYRKAHGLTDLIAAAAASQSAGCVA